MIGQRLCDPEYQELRRIQRLAASPQMSRAERMVEFTLDGGELALLRLGVDWTVTPEALKKAYREASKHAHPDRGGSQADFVELGRAHELVKALLG